MPKALPKRTCPTCSGHRVKRNGSTTAGTPRYRCLDCGASHTLKRPQTSDANTYTSFVDYLLGKASQAELKRGSDRTIRRSFSWCWLVPVPPPIVTGEVYDQVFIDATYLHDGWVLLIACTASHVIGWQLATRESSAAYTQLLTPIPPPKTVVTDGAGGALKAIKPRGTPLVSKGV